MMETRTPWYLHVDLDAFFASVEQLDHPEYKGKPVIVGGRPEDKRSVVSTASYEARKFGVHSAMPTYQAYKLCPQGIYVHGRMQRYAELSYQIMSIFREYSPDVIQMSIDEAFIDITGTEKLFGPPEQTAMKIKAHVKQFTGLTVSVGLATTKYLAKIASGYSKPDGFYFIKPGTEQEFMLNLPLDKVWGVGKKTLETLRNKGIFTTRDIYEKTYDSLEFMFGKNTANFLYNIVRGVDTVNFGHEAKKHSISAESTFVDDIHDIYTAETKLMELCQGVIFRLIKEEVYSRTAFIKIRYDDFSTVSIQTTVDRNILTLDSYFEIIKDLFEKKYENGRGIRLLGVGFDNIEKEDKPYQQDLFDNGNEKKQAVEKAIIGLEKKHPEIKIHKARTLEKGIKSIGILLLSTLLFMSPKKIYAEEPSKTEITGAGTILSDSFIEAPISEESEALFNFDVNDTNNVEFLVSGFWKANLESALNLSFGKNTPFTCHLLLPVFTQEVDISAWILINQKWYFETDFADGFEKNTLAIGYNGNGYLKSFRLSNRGITMPSVYSANMFGYGLSGGNNQAPGISVHFSDLDNSRWFGDFIIRYDMTKTNNATFYGKNSVTDTTILPSNFLYGKKFIFPSSSSSALANIDSIYVENKNGEYKDKNGKRYKKLSATDYTIIQSSAEISFSKSAETSRQNNKIPQIIVTFADSTIVSKIIQDVGSYDDETSFAGQIQTFFNSYTESPVSLSKFSYEMETQIDNKTGLIIQNSILFSPFLCANIYDCGIYSQSDLFVQSKSTEKLSTEYIAEELTTDSSSVANDFLQENHLYAQVTNSNFTGKSLQYPQTRYPFADSTPEIYLNLPSLEDLELVVRNYSPVSDFNIGTEAIEGTVQVYINNMLDSGAEYNAETGEITFSKAVSQIDKIYVVWQEDASDYTGGALSTGSGLFFNINPYLSTDFSITSRWPLSINEKYSTPDSPLFGFAALSSGITYSKNNFTLQDKVALSVNSENSSGNLLVLEQNSFIPQTYYLSSSDGFVTNAEPSLPKYGIFLSQEKNCTIRSHAGKTDSGITGYKIPLEYDFSLVDQDSAMDITNPYWAAVDIHLENGSELKKASNLELALQSSYFKNENIDYYIQLGIDAAADFNGEDVKNIPVWKISGETDSKVNVFINRNSEKWQTVKISLNDEDRARLSSSDDIRLIAVYNPVTEQQNAQKGIVFFGPYEPLSQSIFTPHSDSISVDSFCTPADLPTRTRLNILETYSTTLNWTVLDSDKIAADSKITATSYFESADFSNYKTINFEFASTQTGKVTLILQNKEAISMQLTLNDLSAYVSAGDSPVYHTITVNIGVKSVAIDSQVLSSSDYELLLFPKIVPNNLEVGIGVWREDEIIEKGQFYIGNLYYGETDVYFNVQNYALAKFQKEDNFISLSSMQSPDSITAQAEAGITVANIRLESDVSSLLDAGHSVYTTSSFFKYLSFNETYRFSKNDETLDKTDSIGLNFENPYVPVKFDFQTSAKDFFNTRTQNTKISADISSNIKDSKIGLASSFEADQKINTNKNTLNSFNTDNYFNGWYDISTLQFSTGEKEASSRNQTFNTKLYSSFTTAALKPELSYSLGTVYQNISESSLKDITKIKFSVPFSLASNNFSFEIERIGSGEGITRITESSYITDAQTIASSFNSKFWIYSSIPFYDLFDKSLVEKINTLPQNTQTTDYEALYQFVWKRKLTNTIKDVFIPSSTTLAFSRDIKGGTKSSDMYQIKCIVSNTAINSFGSDSSLQLFNWYSQDEIMSNLTGIIKIPLDNISKPTFTLSTYQQDLFYISKDSVLKTGIDYSLETSLDWTLRTTLVWTRPGLSSFVTDFLYLIIKQDEKISFEIKRNDIFNFSIGQTEKILKQKYEYNHNTDFKFLKYYTFTTGLGTSLSLVENAADTMTLTLSLGVKMEF